MLGLSSLGRLPYKLVKPLLLALDADTLNELEQGYDEWQRVRFRRFPCVFPSNILVRTNISRPPTVRLFFSYAPLLLAELKARIISGNMAS